MRDDGLDIIGDVHGHVEPVVRLLLTMGYTQRGDGAWAHPARTAVFIGDLIDRGPHQREVMDLVRRMVDAGTARAVLGNHELNALGYATEHAEGGGRFLRPHVEKNYKQHRAFLAQVGSDPTRPGVWSAAHREALDWFRTLPLWLDLPGLRVIHACWEAGAIARLTPQLGPDGTITEALLQAGFTRHTQTYDDLETLLKGLEAKLPDGFTYQDKEGTPRNAIRLRWWQENGTRNARALAMAPADSVAKVPDIDLDTLPPFPSHDHRPCVIGHYWLDGTPRRQHPMVACVDYSVAAVDSKERHKVEDARMCAYRWSGESEIADANFVHVRASG
jgi:hypothetical protein